MATKKILVIDDDESILDAISLTLEDAGYTIQTEVKGQQAYHAVDAFQPDLILLDVLMSGNDGRIICKNLKHNPKTSSIPILMISAHPSAKKGSVECGADDFLPKPFGGVELVKKVSHILNSTAHA